MSRNIVYYRNENGRCFFDEFLSSLDDQCKIKITVHLRYLSENVFLSEPYFKKMKSTDGLWEGRVHCDEGIIRYMFFFYKGNAVILTHAFWKKTNKTPINEIKKAVCYKKDYLKRHKEG